MKLTIDDFTRIGKHVPVLSDLKPSGKHLMCEVVAIGGIGIGVWGIIKLVRSK